MRRHLAQQGFGADRGFRWRGGEISRLEGLSDAVFAFAVTLLVVSLEVPETFNELLRVLRGSSPLRSASRSCSGSGTTTTGSSAATASPTASPPP
jgi:hypothetical protein